MKIIASGTFDHLHEGHKLFLKTAFMHGYVMIGLSSGELTMKKKYTVNIEDYRARKRNLVKWLAMEGHIESKDYEIIKITDPMGFSCDIKDIDAILVTEENDSIVSKINSCRSLKGYQPLRSFSCPLLKDKKGKVSSTRLRGSIVS